MILHVIRFKSNDDREGIREQCLNNQAAYHRISAQPLLASPGEYLDNNYRHKYLLWLIIFLSSFIHILSSQVKVSQFSTQLGNHILSSSNHIYISNLFHYLSGVLCSLHIIYNQSIKLLISISERQLFKTTEFSMYRTCKYKKTQVRDKQSKL